MGLTLDSSVVIDAERRGHTAEQLIEAITLSSSEQSVALSAVGLTELVHGLHRAQTPPRSALRHAFLSDLTRDLAILPYTREAALLAGRIIAEQQNVGINIPYSNLLIGATALSIDYGVLTLNVRHFAMIPGLRVVAFQQASSESSCL